MNQRKSWRRGAALTLGLAFGLAVSSGALATTLEHVHVDDLSSDADTVIVGTVRSQEAIRTDGAINTLLTVRVKDAITGQPGSTVEVLVPGGSIVSNGFRVGEINAGIGVYGIDSEMVLFLTSADADGQRRIMGFSQGQFAVSGGQVSVPDLGGAVSLQQFKARIRANATP